LLRPIAAEIHAKVSHQPPAPGAVGANGAALTSPAGGAGAGGVKGAAPAPPVGGAGAGPGRGGGPAAPGSTHAPARGPPAWFPGKDAARGGCLQPEGRARGDRDRGLRGGGSRRKTKSIVPLAPDPHRLRPLRIRTPSPKDAALGWSVVGQRVRRVGTYL